MERSKGLSLEARDAHVARRRDRYAERRAAGLCVNCGDEPGRVVNGKVTCYCETCWPKKRACRKTPEARAKAKEYQIRRYHDFVKAGRCPRCSGKRPAAKQFGWIECITCYRRDKEVNQESHERTRKRRNKQRRLRYLASKQLGLCARDGCKHEAVPGFNMCDYHLEYQAEAARAHRQRKKRQATRVAIRKAS